MVQAQRDPWRTASVLLAFLIEYNIVLAFLHIVTAALFGLPINPTDRVWDFNELHFTSMSGYRIALVQTLTAVLLIPIEVLQIARAKLILDFAMTAQASHLLLTCLYSRRFPYTWSWWFVWLLTSCIMVFGGEYACMQIELRPIVFGTTVDNSNTRRAEIPVSQEGRISTSDRLGRLSNITERSSNDDIELQERNSFMEEGHASRIKG